MAGKKVKGLEDLGGKLAPMGDERLHQTAPGFCVPAERGLGVVEITLEGDGRAVVEGMGERGRRVNPPEAVGMQRQGRKERRTGGERMDSRSEIVEEAGEGELKGAGGAARLRFGLEDVDAKASLRKDDGGGEAVGASADDGGAAITHGVEARRASRWR